MKEENMDLEDIIKKIKEENNLKQIYVTTVAEQDIVWRKLKRSEYREVMSTEFSANEDLAFLEKQDLIAKMVILFPENVDELLEEYAGISDIIATETMIKTGFGMADTKEA